MTIRINLRGQILELDESDVDHVMRILVQQTRQRIWLPARLNFDAKYSSWQQHNRYHNLNLMLWAMELAGGVAIPPASRVSPLRSTRTTLENSLSPRRLERFYRVFARWHPRAQRFSSDMYDYLQGLQLGGRRVVRGLVLTRDTSFMLLSALAALPTGGGSLAVTGSAVSARVIAVGASRAFAVRTVESCATMLGRSIAGERITPVAAASQVVENAINAVPDAMMGRLVQHFMRPLTGFVQNAVAREIARGSLANGIAIQFSGGAVQSAVQNAIDGYIGRNPGRVRMFVAACPANANDGRVGALVGEAMMADRSFRQYLERELQALSSVRR